MATQPFSEYIINNFKTQELLANPPGAVLPANPQCADTAALGSCRFRFPLLLLMDTNPLQADHICRHESTSGGPYL